MTCSPAPAAPARGSGSCRPWVPCTRATRACSGRPASGSPTGRWSPRSSSTRSSSARPRTSTATRAPSTPTSRSASARASTSSSRPPSRRSTRAGPPSRRSPSSPARWPPSSRAGPGPATSAAYSPWSPSCSAWSARTSRCSDRRTTSSWCWSAGWSRTCASGSRRVDVVGAETVREPDGLALSSRNRYLDADQRLEAAALSRALRAAQVDAERGVDAALGAARAQLRATHGRRPRLPRGHRPRPRRAAARRTSRHRGPHPRRRQGRQHPADRQPAPHDRKAVAP